MSAKSRLAYLEQQLDRDDLTDMEWDSFNKEANLIQEQLNEEKKIRDAEKAIRLKEAQEEAEIAFAESITEEAVEKMYIDTCLKYQDVNGISFKDWYEKSVKYYTIDANNVVHSRARSPKAKHIDSVPCHTIGNAKLRILTLIKTKFNDHANRGYDFKWDIEDENL